jgi:spore germination cell wall hydrolase CwlJ-like protein
MSGSVTVRATLLALPALSLLSALAGCGSIEGRVVEMPEAVVPLKRGDVDVLARTLYGENRGGGVPGMQSVAWVVVNRANAPGSRWPSTISGVCKQRQQFSCWNPEDVNAKLCAVINESDVSYLLALYAATSVLSGQVEDMTQGATHYHASSMKVLPYWAGKMHRTVVFAGHTFYNEP